MKELEHKVEQLNSLLRDIQRHKAANPEDRCSYSPSVIGSLLNAYREGDVGFDDCVKLLTQATVGVWDESDLSAQVSKLSDVLKSEAYRGYSEEEYNRIIGTAYSLQSIAALIRKKGKEAHGEPLGAEDASGEQQKVI